VSRTSLSRSWRAAKVDIQRGRNLDTYIAVAIGAVVTVLGLVGVVSVPIELAALLGTMVIIILFEVEQLHILDRIESKAGSQSFRVVHLRDEDYDKQIRTASRITLVTLLNFRWLAANSGTISDYLKRGGLLRELVMDVQSDEALYVATVRAFGASRKTQHTMGQYQLTVDKLREFAALAPKGTLQVKQIPFATAHVITWFEFDYGPNIMYVTPSGFMQKTDTRPTFVIEQDTDPDLYSYFEMYTENLWGWEKSTIMELDDDG
jgi:hypothetical protein